MFLKEICNFKNGKSTKIMQNGIYPIIGSSSKIGFSNEYNIDEPTICVGRVGAYAGSLQYIESRGWATDNVIRCTPKHNIEAKFLYYLLSTLSISTYRIGTSQPLITINILNNIEFDSVSLRHQQHIVDTIGSIDNLIEKNNKIIEKTKYLSTLIYYQYKEKSVVVSTQSFLKDNCPIHTGKLDANAAKENGSYAFFTCSNDYSLIDEYAYDGKSIIVAGNGVINVRYYDGKFNAYQRVYVLQPKQNLFLYLKEIESNIQSLLRGANGSVIKFITKGMLEEINIPINDNTETINNKIGRLYDYISKLENENVILNKIKKILLHKYFD